MKHARFVATLFLLTACGAAPATTITAGADNFPIPAVEDPGAATTTSALSPAENISTTVPNQADGPRWPVGTVTCAELEGSFPNGADDHRIDLDQGIVTFYDQPDGAEQTIQFMNDVTCTTESEAWMYMIGIILEPDLLYTSGGLCEWYAQLPHFDPPPANLETVEAHLTAAAQLCG